MKWFASNSKKHTPTFPYHFHGVAKEPISESKRAYFGTRKSLFRNPKEPISERERAYFGIRKSIVRMTRVLLLAFQIAVFAGLWGCGDSVEEQRRISRAEHKRLAEEEQRALKIAVSPTIDCLPLFVAEAYGLFKQSGSDIRLKYFTADMDCDTAMIGGSVEGVVSDLVRTEQMKDRSKVALEYVASTAADWQLLANRKSRVKRLEQLGDKMVAATRFSATDALTSTAFDGVKLKAPIYRIQVNDEFVRQMMFHNNEVEAAWFQEPLATAARLKGGHLLTRSSKLKQSLGVIAFRAEALKDKQRKPQLDAFKKVYNMACDSINKHGVAHYADIMHRYYRVDAETARAIPALRFSHVSPPKQEDIETAKSMLKKLKTL